MLMNDRVLRIIEHLDADEELEDTQRLERMSAQISRTDFYRSLEIEEGTSIVDVASGDFGGHLLCMIGVGTALDKTVGYMTDHEVIRLVAMLSDYLTHKAEAAGLATANPNWVPAPLPETYAPRHSIHPVEPQPSVIG